MKIIYPAKDGTIAIIFPCECGLSVQEIAKKDVPYNAPFLIVPDNALPEDWTLSTAWEASFSNPTGFGLGPQRWFIQQAAAVIADPNSTPEQIEAAMQLSEQMQREIIQLEGAPM